MKTKIQIKSIFGKILFEFEKEDNSIKDTLIEAVNQKVNLCYADLSSVDLSFANLHSANLHSANLSFANLHSADLSSVDLSFANLHSADLSFANLHSVDLSFANLSSVDLKRIQNFNTIVPEGELIVWKKLQNNLIAKLLIPVKAKRVNCIGSRKCRFEFVKVIAIYDSKKKVNEGVGIYDSNFVYKVGKIIKPNKFDPSPLIECSNGIHAFITRQEAEDYN